MVTVAPVAGPNTRSRRSNDDGDDVRDPVITQEGTNTRARFRQGLFRGIFLSLLCVIISMSRRTRLSFSRYTRRDFRACTPKKTKRDTRRFCRNFLNDLPSVLASAVFCLFLSSFPLEPLTISRSLRDTTTLCHVDSAPVVHRPGAFPVAMDDSRASSIIQTGEDDWDERSGGLRRRSCLLRNDSSTFLRLRDALRPFS